MVRLSPARCALPLLLASFAGATHAAETPRALYARAQALARTGSLPDARAAALQALEAQPAFATQNEANATRSAGGAFSRNAAAARASAGSLKSRTAP